MSTKITRRPLNKGAPRFPSMQSQTQTEEGYIHRSMQAGTAGGVPSKGRKGANLPGNDIPRVFYIPIIYFQRRYASTDFPTVTSRQSKGTSGSCPLIASPPEGGEDLKKLISRKNARKSAISYTPSVVRIGRSTVIIICHIANYDGLRKTNVFMDKTNRVASRAVYDLRKIDVVRRFADDGQCSTLEASDVVSGRLIQLEFYHTAKDTDNLTGAVGSIRTYSRTDRAACDSRLSVSLGRAENAACRLRTGNRSVDRAIFHLHALLCITDDAACNIRSDDTSRIREVDNLYLLCISTLRTTGNAARQRCGDSAAVDAIFHDRAAAQVATDTTGLRSIADAGNSNITKVLAVFDCSVRIAPCHNASGRPCALCSDCAAVRAVFQSSLVK